MKPKVLLSLKNANLTPISHRLENNPKEIDAFRYPDDCPLDTIDEASFSKMLDLKFQKSSIECETFKLTEVLKVMQQLLKFHEEQVALGKKIYAKEVQDMRDHLQMMETELWDYEILLRLISGQVEVPQAAVVTDYSDSVFFQKAVVESRNRRIIDLGAEKIQILEAMKEFRKKINQVVWEQQTLDLQKLDLEEKTKDVHMLRVTKNMQAILKGSDDANRLKHVLF